MTRTERIDRLLLAAATALLVARPLYPSESAAQGDGLTWVMLWLVLATLWALTRAVGRARAGQDIGASRAAGVDAVDLVVIALLAWHVLAAAAAIAERAPRPALNMMWLWIGMGVALMLLRRLIATERHARAVAAVMIALGVALAGYGVYQSAVELPATRAWYQANPEAALQAAGVATDPASPERKLFEDRLAGSEPLATFALTNSLAGYLAPWLLVLVGLLLFGRCPRRTLIGGMLAAVPIAACLWLTHGRSAQLALAVGLLALAAIGLWRARPALKRVARWSVPVGVGILVVTLAITTLLAGRMELGNAAKSLGYRGQYWRSTLAMIADHPLLGVGPGNFQFEYTREKLPWASEEVADPHNFLLEVGATAGIPAAVLLLVVLGLVAKRVIGARRQAEQQRLTSDMRGEADEIVVLVGGVLGFLLSVPLGSLGAAPPGIAPVVIGLPLAAATAWALLPWIRSGTMPRWLPALGVGVLSVHLLAAGGIGFPGVAMSWWLLIALALPSPAGRQRGQWRVGMWAVTACALLLAVACYVSAFGPVVRARGSLRAADVAMGQGRVDEARESLRTAAAIDPLWAQPHRRLSIFALGQWLRSGDPAALARFVQHDDRVLELLPHAAEQWRRSGLAYQQIWQRTGRPADAQHAADALKQAAGLYPTSAAIRADLALAQRDAGQIEAAGRNAREAVWLDRITPHADKKLSPTTRRQMWRLLGKPPGAILE